MRARAVIAVFAKEMVETLRDRRTLIVALLLPVLMMPVVTLGVPYLAQRQQQQRQAAASRVAVVGIAGARDLIALGRERGLIAVVETDRPRDALRRGEADAILEIPADFVARVAAGTAEVVVTYDEGEARSMIARQRIQELIAVYSVGIAEARLRARGVSSRDLAPVRLTERNTADERRRGGVLLAGLLPFFIAIWAVLGGQHAALDLGAGEKERRTLETLLVSPPSRWALAGGKFLAVLAASLAAVLMVIATALASLRLGARWGLADLARTSITIAPPAALWLCAIAGVLAAFLSALQLALSLVARSVREAQQFFTPVYLVITLPAMAAPFLDGWERSGWTYLAPALNAVFAIRGLLLLNVHPGSLLATLGSTTAYAALALWWAVRALQREPQHVR